MSALSGEHVVKGPLRKFIAGIEKRTVRPGSLLLVGEWNRLTRQISSDALKLSICLMEHGIGIVDLQDEAYYTLDRYNADIGLQLSLQLKISMAHQYSANLRHNLNAKWVARREAMLVDPTAHASNACPEWLEAVDGVHRKIEARIAVIERIKGYRYLGLGKHAIATRLNTIDPVPAFRSTNGWHPSSVEKLVKNRALMGFYTPHYADGSAAGPERKRYPEVVKPNDWWRMQWPQDDAKPKGGRRPAEMRNLLHRTCICRCGGRMIYVDKGGRRRELLVCTNAKRGKCDNRYWWKYAPLEAELLTALSLVDFTKFLDRHDPQIERIAALEAEIANIAATVEELLDEFRAKKPASVAKRIAVWEAEKDALVVERDQLRREARIAEANANRDAYDEFKALVASLPSIVEGERERVRTRINTELRGMIDTAIADGSHLVVRLAAAPWHRLEILFDESRLTEFRLTSYRVNGLPDEHVTIFPREAIIPFVGQPGIAGMFADLIGLDAAVGGKL
jgi:hypothetical protein